MSHPVVHFDYDFSPYGQKIRSVLAGTHTRFHRADVPAVLPRPTLEQLAITYRRIPVTAIGKDVYADTALIIDVLQATAPSLGGRALAATPADKAYETFGKHVFQSALSVIPLAALTPDFVKDRATIFPFLQRPDYAELRPSGLAEWRAVLGVVERDFLSPGPFIAGPALGLADLHVGFSVGWALQKLGVAKEPGFSAKDFPRVYAWLAQLPQAQAEEELSAEQAIETVLKAEYSAKAIGVDEGDYLGFKQGQPVNVESVDADPGAHPQHGTLVGLDGREVVIELANGLRLHFPREGYVVKGGFLPLA